jgi:DNA (cytosine-5)-methyltransferase 1
LDGKNFKELKEKKPTYLSLFSGAGGFELGFDEAGWECVGQIENDPRCISVLSYHWPNVPKWEDIRTVRGEDLPYADVIVFGSPCKDLSVAGYRRGLHGNESILYLDACRIINEMREVTHGRFPRIVVWENVYSTLSSSKGNDFAKAIDILAEFGAVDIGWRVLDASFFGVPHRRRRIIVVADFAEKSVGKILFEADNLRWNSASRFTPWTELTRVDLPSIKRNCGLIAEEGIVQTLTRAFGIAGPDAGHAQAGWFIPDISPSSFIRKITPLEAERLMGWPDFHTMYGKDGKVISDSARYQMCGNGVVAPVAQWLAERIWPAI